MSNKYKLIHRVIGEDKNDVRRFSLSALTSYAIQRECAKMGLELTGAESVKAVDSLVSKKKFRIRNSVLEVKS